MTDKHPQLGPFRLAEQLGEGGMGSVFRATHDRTGVDVALKVVKTGDGDDFRRQLHREVQAHAGLIHPGIVYLFDYGEISHEAAHRTDELTAGSPWVAMQLADGGTIRDLMPFSGWHDVRDVLLQTLDALAYAHARDVVHRDLKPDNLLVFEDDASRRIKLADFGIAHAYDDRTVHERDSDELRHAAGTPLYMSPEQIRGKWRDYGPWTDIYSLGCIAYQLVCGRPPFVADNPITLTVHHCNEDRPRLDPQFPVPDGLEDWIRRAMAIDYTGRFWRAADAARALPIGDDIPSTPVEPDAGNIETMETVAASATTEVTATKMATLPPTEILSNHPGRPTASSTSPSTLRSDDSATSPPAGKRSESTHTTSSPATSGSGGSGPTPHGGGSMGATRTTEQLDDLPHWRTDDLHDLPTPLVGTGLELFDLRQPPFVNRDRELQSLFDRLDEVRRSDGFRLVLVCGSSGTGKSRLVQKMARRADEMALAGAVQITHSPGTKSRSEGLGGLVLRTSHGWHLGRDELYEHLLGRLPDLGDTDQLEFDARALTELAFPTASSDDDVDGPRFSFDSPRQRHLLIDRFFRRIQSARTPMVWLEDLQWGPEATRLLEFLADRSDRPTGLFVATLRTEELTANPRLADRIERIEDHDVVDRIDLTPLCSDDHRRFVELLLPMLPDLTDRIAERTEGNPLFARQLVGNLVAGDRLEVTDQGFRLTDGAKLQLPDDIYNLWETRFRRLLSIYPSSRTDDVAEVVELAATLGRNIDVDEWTAVCRRADQTIPDDLVEHLVERGLARWTDDGWRFSHGMFVDCLRRRARESGRQPGHHRRCARMLERRYPDRPRQTARRRAEHWLEAGEPERALEPLLEESTRLARKGHRRRQIQVLKRRHRLLDDLNVGSTERPRIETDIALTTTRRLLGDIDAPLELFERLLERSREANARDLAIECHEAIGIVQSRRGAAHEALEAFERGLELARRVGATDKRADLHLKTGWHALFHSDLESARDHARRASELAADIDPESSLRAALLRHVVLVAEGEYRRARPGCEQLLATAEQKNYRYIEFEAHTALGDIARYLGEFETARRHYSRALTISETSDELHNTQTSLSNLAQTTVAMGRYDQSRRLLKQLDRQLAESPDDSPQLSTLRDLVSLTMAAGQRNWAKFDDQFEMFADGSALESPVARDYPWLLERIADYCLDATHPGRATRILELALEFWQQLGDDEALERTERRLESLEETD